MFYSYLLRCSDDSYYAGHTDDIEVRLAMHQTGILRGYTHSRRPVSLVFCESFATRDDAFLRERQIKGWSRAKKDALVEGKWEELVRLAAMRGEWATSVDEAALAHPSSASG